MGNFRHAVIEEDVDLSTDGMHPVDIDFTDICSRLEFQIRYKNKGSPHTAQDGHPHGIITKLEVVDGSDVLVSLTGKQLAAMVFYDNGNCMHDRNSCQTSTTGHFALPLDFGRFLGDPVLALDPTQFDNPQIKLTHAKSGLDADLQSVTFGLFAYLFDEKKITPKGFIMRKEIKSWASAASQVEYSELPRDFPYRQAYIQGYATTKEIRTCCDVFELYEGERSKILIPEMEMYDWIMLVTDKWGYVREFLESDVSGTYKTMYTMPSYQKAALLIPEYDGYCKIAVNEGEQLGIASSNAGAGAEKGECVGEVPHHIVPLLLHDMQNPDEWFVPKPDVKLKLKVTAKSDSSSSYTSAILLEQNRPY